MLQNIARCVRLALAASLLVLSISGCDSAGATASQQALTDHDRARDLRERGALATDVILVHGAWADGSSWSDVIRILQRRGFTVRAVQLAQQTLAADAALVRHTIDRTPRPVVVAGHSYGGFVMSAATSGATNVVGLVFVAAFAPAEGENLQTLVGQFPPTPTLQNLVVDDLGNATIAPDAFVQYFADGVPRRDARVLEAVQHPGALSIFATPAGPPGWATIPSFYQVSTEDQVIHPDMQRMFAERMHAETIELRTGHLSLITRPHAVASLIQRAAGVDSD